MTDINKTVLVSSQGNENERRGNRMRLSVFS